MLPFRRSVASKALLTNPFQLHTTLSVPGLNPEAIEVKLDIATQHTLSWDSALADGATGVELIGAGSCCLYVYPTVTDAISGVSAVASGPSLEALDRLITEIVKGESGFDEATDEVGAYMQHAITVANTDAALGLVESLFRAKPRLLRQVHARHRLGFPLFTGESSLHILAVNRRESLLRTLIELAVSRLSRAEATELFTTQATGVFFEDPPMCFYGGTPLAYACAFELREAIVAYLTTGLVGLNDRLHACQLTGFLPIHTAVAHGHVELYDWMTDELREEWRAEKRAESSIGRLSALSVHGLKPLALATMLGDHDTVRHLLRKQTVTLWVWGPVTQHSISLVGIDSTNSGGADMLELVARIGASRGTQMLLLDSFMQGFLYKLFLLKWRKYRVLYLSRLALDLTLAALLVATALALKADPSAQRSLRPLLVAKLALMGSLMLIELRITGLWIRDNSEEEDARDRVPFSQKLRDMASFLGSHSIFNLLASYVCGAASAILLLMYEIEAHGVSPISGSKPTAVTASVWSAAYSGRVEAADSGQITGIVWLTLSLSIFLMMPYIAASVFTPFEAFNVFMLSLVKILRSDLVIFLVIFVVYLATFYLTLYTLYPRAGEGVLPHMLDFNDWYTSGRALLELAFTGSPAMIDLKAAAAYEGLSASQAVDLVVFVVIYLFYAILSVVLLLNLLIAMFTHTFDSVRNESTLNSRIAFAQVMLKLELSATSLGMKTAVGEDKGGGHYTYDFRSVAENGPVLGGSGGAGGKQQANDADPFKKTIDGPFEKLELRMEELQSQALAQIRAEVRQQIGNVDQKLDRHLVQRADGATGQKAPTSQMNNFGQAAASACTGGTLARAASSGVKRTASIRAVFMAAKLSNSHSNSGGEAGRRTRGLDVRG